MLGIQWEKEKREGMCLNGMNKVREMSHKAIFMNCN